MTLFSDRQDQLNKQKALFDSLPTFDLTPHKTKTNDDNRLNIEAIKTQIKEHNAAATAQNIEKTVLAHELTLSKVEHAYGLCIARNDVAELKAQLTSATVVTLEDCVATIVTPYNLSVTDYNADANHTQAVLEGLASNMLEFHL